MSSATLRIYGHQNAMTCEVKAVSDDSWSEGSLTWNNRPGFGSTVATTFCAADVWNELDVTAYVNSELDGDGVISIGLKGTTSTSIKLRSDDNASNPPELVLVP